MRNSNGAAMTDHSSNRCCFQISSLLDDEVEI